MIIGHKAYPLGKGHTKLEDDDYAFLRRFLDATKANLFFARGIVVVEGDAENLLLPAIAKKIGKPFAKHGVSIVNVGHRGLFRYSRILQRIDGTAMPVPVALIPDRDIPPDVAKVLVGDRATEGEWEADKKTAHLENLLKHDGGAVKAFPSEQWTFEFDLARQPGCAVIVHQAIQIAKGRAGKTTEKIAAEAKTEVEAWQADEMKTADDVAVSIFEPLYKHHISKAVVAEQLAALIEDLPDGSEEFKDRLPAYVVDAIEYVTNSSAPAVPPEQAPPAAEEVAEE